MLVSSIFVLSLTTSTTNGEDDLDSALFAVTRPEYSIEFKPKQYSGELSCQGSAHFERMRLGKNEWLCTIPIQAQRASSAEETKPEFGASSEQANALVLGQAKEILADTFGTNCAYWQDATGWWTYEFCPATGIRQFHLFQNIRNPPPKKIRNAKGYLVPENENEFDLGSKALEHKLIFDPIEQVYSVQLTFIDGDYCALADQPRTTEVRFACAEQQPIAIRETSTCKYRVWIAISALCDLPLFNNVEDSEPSLPIECYPV